MQRQELGPELGKIPLHGERRNSIGHKIYAAELEVDQEKISMIETLIPPTTVKGIRSFLGYAGFYKRFIQDFSKIAKPLCRLLEKDIKFDFDEA